MQFGGNVISSMVVPQKVKTQTIVKVNNFTSVFLQKKLKSEFLRELDAHFVAFHYKIIQHTKR